MKKTFRIFIILLPVSIFIVWVWVIFVKLKSDSVVEIETLISESKWKEALQNIESELNKNHDSSMHLYLLGSAAIFGLKEEKKALQKNRYRDYKYQLIRRDPTGLFLRESFLYQFKMFHKSKRIFDLVCEYVEYFPNSASKQRSFQNSFRLILKQRIPWLFIKSDCFSRFFEPEWNFLDQQKFIVNKPRAALKSGQGRNARIVKRLKANDVVLLLNDQLSQNKNYFYVVDKTQRAGWGFKQDFMSF